MRLIDADEMLNVINTAKLITPPEKDMLKIKINELVYKSITELINAVPTAYDIDKVVEQIEDEKEFHEQIEYSLLALGYRSAYKKAIEIVKGGAE
mgnify:CR=1 FL=1